MDTLERLQNQGDDKAGQFLASIMRFQFIIALVVAEHILHTTVSQHSSKIPITTFLKQSKNDVIQVHNQIVQKWILQRNSPILFWRFRGVISLS
jgi:acyl carrier protein phosphodiesterase